MGKPKPQFFKDFQNQAATRSLKIVQWAINALPRNFVQFLVEPFFSIAYRFTKNLNQICIKNLQSAYGASLNEDECRAMCKNCIKNIGRCMMDLLYFVNRPKKLSEAVTITNEKYLKSALNKGKGVIAITAHLGNFPLLFVSLRQRGYKVNVIIRRMRDENFSVFMYDLCALWDINMIQLHPRKNFVRESLAALRRNELLFILFDEMAASDEGVSVDFLNQKVRRATGPMLFHQRTDSPILPVFIVQDERRDFKIFIEQELKVEENFSPDNNIRNISKLTKTIESFVKNYPVQWGGWLNKKWVLE